MKELVIDSFAGGGGASEGIKVALGRDPDIAVNHDRFALAMHRVNHPGTRHLIQDVAVVDSVGLCAGQPVGMLWMSPDCTDHSKAKGSAPIRNGDTSTRGIGWAIVGWVKALPAWQRPRVVFLENVEEYEDWGPLLPDGKRDPLKKGAIFRQFVAAWNGLGYSKIEWRQRRAWQSGAGTIRKRLFMIMRRDGEEIVWPEPTHGNPNDPADAVRIAAGELKPWVTVADGIDFSLPCPSIFDTTEEIRAKYGIRAKRPLAFNTMSRLAKGTKRRVLDAALPFMVKVNHTSGDARDRSVEMPLSTMTGKRDDAVAVPFVTKFRTGSVGHSVEEPIHTITAHSSEHHGGGDGKSALVAAFMAQHTAGSHPGQPSRDVGEPASTITTLGSQQGLIAASMMTMRNSEMPDSRADAPSRTLVANGAAECLIASSMLTLRGSDRRDAGADEPARTSSAAGNHNALVSLPLMTVYYGTDDDGASVDEPSRTETAKPRFGLAECLAAAPPFGPEHYARARQVAEFLRSHGCWAGSEFVTIEVDGVTLVIVDIGMRMLTPRERFNAQGFRRDYTIDHGIDENSNRIEFTLEQQGYMCGNSVCPPEAAALVGANYRPRDVVAPRSKRASRDREPLLDFTMEAAE